MLTANKNKKGRALALPFLFSYSDLCKLQDIIIRIVSFENKIISLSSTLMS